MDKTRLQILSEVLHIPIEYFAETNLHADTEHAIEAMKIAMRQAWIVGVKNAFQSYNTFLSVTIDEEKESNKFYDYLNNLEKK